MTKLCTGCGKILPKTSEFWFMRKKNGKEYVRTKCKECYLLEQQLKRNTLEGKEKRRKESNKTYRAKTPEIIRVKKTSVMATMQIISQEKKTITEKKIIEVVKNRRLNIDISSINMDQSEENIWRDIYPEYDKYIESIIKKCNIDFPWPILNSRKAKIEFEHLKVNNNINNLLIPLINSVHRSIWKSRSGNTLSPYEAWHDKKLIDSIVRNRFIYSQSKDIDVEHILRGFSVTRKCRKVSVFKPALAKYLINKYVKSDIIIDPFSGFSGRLLGSLASNKEYTGYDIRQEAVDESNEICSIIGFQNKVLCSSVEDLNIVNMNACLLTCPPYGWKEVWNGVISRDEDYYIDTCLKNIQCKSYLFVVGNTVKYKSNIVEEITNKSHFGSNKEYVVLL